MSPEPERDWRRRRAEYLRNAGRFSQLVREGLTEAHIRRADERAARLPDAKKRVLNRVKAPQKSRRHGGA